MNATQFPVASYPQHVTLIALASFAGTRSEPAARQMSSLSLDQTISRRELGVVFGISSKCCQLPSASLVRMEQVFCVCVCVCVYIYTRKRQKVTLIFFLLTEYVHIKVTF
jgi:hypothetical protein